MIRALAGKSFLNHFATCCVVWGKEDIMNRMIRTRLRDLAEALFLQARELQNMGLVREAGELSRRASAYFELALMSPPPDYATIPVRNHPR
jgi:hypothetical protein